jgi:FkbM family methyltransferase
VVDVGAHVGTYTLLASRGVGDRGRVFSFEPNPRIFSFLRDNVARTAYRQRVTLCNQAVSDRHGEHLSFAVPEESSRNSSLHFQPGSPGQKVIEVETVSLDQAVGPGGRVDVVKIDAEGAEASVLRGMKRLTLDNPDLLIFMEYAPEHLARAGESIQTMLEWIADHQFRIYRIADFTPACEEISIQELALVTSANLLLSRRPWATLVGSTKPLP